MSSDNTPALKFYPKLLTRTSTLLTGPSEAPKQPNPNAPKGADLYARFAFAGAVCCAVTHGALTPVDVVKTRIQLEPEKYNRGMLNAFGQVVKNEGAGALLTGVGPTFAGYFLQGAFKFGGYEFWKKTFIDYFGVEKATNNRTAVYLASSAIAEFFADVALCPLEATRIRLVSQPTFANGLVGGFTRLLREEGIIRGFYSGFGPILFKQIPYTMAKFVVYEIAAENIYKAINKPKDQLSNGAITAINLGSGIIAGACAAIVSQPADTLLSKINKQKGAEGEGIVSRLVSMSRQLGIRGLFLGLGARIVMVATLTAGQFAIYGDIKRVLGATQGIDLAKPASK
jgi:solute carrier family 25 phosphate transporter 3